MQKKAGEPVKPPPAPVKAVAKKPAEEAKKGGGFMDSIRNSELFKQADQMGKAQAIQLNSMLEDAGVLEPINQGEGGKKGDKKPKKGGKKK